MITTAIILFALIIFFAVVSFGSLISLVLGIIKKRKKLWVISLTIFFSSVCLLSVIVIYTGAKAVNRTYITTRTLSEQGKASVVNFIAPGPDIKFTRFTGLELPEGGKVITTGNTYFIIEGDYCIVLQVDREVLETWLSNPPPWELDEWRRGPVPDEVGGHVDACYESYTGDEQLIPSSNSSRVWYAAKEYCCSNEDEDWLKFHNGDLLIIDLDSNTVRLSMWDY